MSSPKELVEEAIREHQVVVFSKSWCPYASNAKRLLKGYPGVDDIKIYELDEMTEGGEIQEYLLDKTNQRTVPNVFIKQKHIGGSDDLARFERNGELKKVLAK